MSTAIPQPCRRLSEIPLSPKSSSPGVWRETGKGFVRLNLLWISETASQNDDYDDRGNYPREQRSAERTNEHTLSIRLWDDFGGTGDARYQLMIYVRLQFEELFPQFVADSP